MSDRADLNRVHGVLVVDKPQGPTSHDVVAKVRRALGLRQVGHCGTLDPMATGVLVIAIGQGTKLVSYLTDLDKEYEATISLGVETDSGDAHGEVIATSELSPQVVTELQASAGAIDLGTSSPLLHRALAEERARTRQMPPVLSAIKVRGRSAHHRVRAGEEVQLEERTVAVHELELLGVRASPPELDIRVRCAKGYYVRSLARDLASWLETHGHLTKLRRTRSGHFGLDRSSADLSPDALRDHFRIHGYSLIDAVRMAMPVCQLEAEACLRARRGQRLLPTDFSGPTEPQAWLGPEGTLVAIGQREPDGTGRVLRGFDEC